MSAKPYNPIDTLDAGGKAAWRIAEALGWKWAKSDRVTPHFEAVYRIDAAALYIDGVSPQQVVGRVHDWVNSRASAGLNPSSPGPVDRGAQASGPQRRRSDLVAS